jgi:hypothetical protein
MEDKDAQHDNRPTHVQWSVARLIELVDAAIDSAGAQLARSAGLWAESPDSRTQRRTAAGGVSSRSVLEAAPGERDLSL